MNKEAAEFLEVAADMYGVDCDVRDDYVGRGPTKPQHAVVTHDPLDLMAAGIRHAADTGEAPEMEGLRTDSMGLRTVVY